MNKSDPFRPADDEARALALKLLGEAHHGALATLEPQTGSPMVTRIAVTQGPGGDPHALISTLAAHTTALLADPRCSLLVGEPGKGDPLAHPRLTLFCRAQPLPREGSDFPAAMEAMLAANPKVRLYAGFADFTLFRLRVERASLNGGFGRAWRLDRRDILS
ncbi:MAG: pyridoxamine 5'-phosphate oxidase family protein [Notoacmeibacter sp.]|nr:pyridoxamine 5'-phosphate oxidase family protein [Notoacmeibacter sp.]